MIVFTLIQVKFINKIGNLQRYNYATYIKVQQKEIFKELKVRIKII